MISGWVRGLSDRDIEAALAEVLGPEAALSRSTVSRRIKAEFAEWKTRDLSHGDIPYPEGQAQVAETTLLSRQKNTRRLVVRRTRLPDPQATLWPEWRYHAFVTNRSGTPVELDADHRHHAVQELSIRDLKEGSGLNHCPSGRFSANAAWTVLAAIAHNLVRWTSLLGGLATGLVVAKTVRRQLLLIPGRLTRTARRWTLHLPARCPWAEVFHTALQRLRALPAFT